MVIIWSESARQDLKLIHQYIANDSKHYATQVAQDITSKIEILLNTPYIGKVVPEIGDKNVREISMYSYRIVYELIDDTIYLHGVIHKRRHFDPDTLQQQ